MDQSVHRRKIFPGHKDQIRSDQQDPDQQHDLTEELKFEDASLAFFCLILLIYPRYVQNQIHQVVRMTDASCEIEARGDRLDIVYGCHLLRVET